MLGLLTIDGLNPVSKRGWSEREIGLGNFQTVIGPGPTVLAEVAGCVYLDIFSSHLSYLFSYLCSLGVDTI